MQFYEKWKAEMGVVVVIVLFLFYFLLLVWKRGSKVRRGSAVVWCVLAARRGSEGGSCWGSCVVLAV